MGVLDVEELKDRLSYRVLVGWKAYDSVEPFGEARADLRMGILGSIIANVNRDPKKRKEPWYPQDFMPFLERDVPALTDVDAKIIAGMSRFKRA